LENLVEYFDAQDIWISSMVQQHNDTYWKHVQMMRKQLDGLKDGYNSVCPMMEYLLDIELTLVASAEDLPDILQAAEVQNNSNYAKKMKYDSFPGLSAREIHILSHLKTLKCSALIKPTPTDLFISHDTWTSYTFMLRIFKRYSFKFSEIKCASKEVIFSGYPGSIISMDDFYMLDSGLAIVETTNDVFNLSLYNYVLPQSLLTWMRTFVANRMAINAVDWATLFARYNSGTYNNQWMILDYNLYQNSTKLSPGLFVV